MAHPRSNGSHPTRPAGDPVRFHRNQQHDRLGVLPRLFVSIHALPLAPQVAGRRTRGPSSNNAVSAPPNRRKTSTSYPIYVINQNSPTPYCPLKKTSSRCPSRAQPTESSTFSPRSAPSSSTQAIREATRPPTKSVSGLSNGKSTTFLQPPSLPPLPLPPSPPLPSPTTTTKTTTPQTTQ